jgi:hypothetical protein
MNFLFIIEYLQKIHDAFTFSIVQHCALSASTIAQIGGFAVHHH